jgi:hypothetical protein
MTRVERWMLWALVAAVVSDGVVTWLQYFKGGN